MAETLEAALDQIIPTEKPPISDTAVLSPAEVEALNSLAAFLEAWKRRRASIWSDIATRHGHDSACEVEIIDAATNLVRFRRVVPS